MFQIKLNLSHLKIPEYPVVWRILGMGLLLGLLVLSLLPIKPLMGFKLEDKAAHFAAYCVLSLYHLQVYPKKTIWTILFLSGFGVTMELLQSLTTYRSFEVWDIVANMTGIFGGLGLVFTPLGQSLKWIEKSWNRKNEAK